MGYFAYFIILVAPLHIVVCVKPDIIIGGPNTKQLNLDVSLMVDIVPVTKEHITEDLMQQTTKEIVKYKQVWKDLDVPGYGATFAHYKNKPRKIISGKLVEGIDDDLDSPTPRISLKHCLESVFEQKSKEHPHCKTYFHPTDENSGKFKLIVFIDTTDSKAKLAYRLDFLICRINMENDITDITNAFIVYDANTGNILESFEKLMSYRMKGEGGNIFTGKITYGEGHYTNRSLIVRSGRDNIICRMKNRRVTVSSASVLNAKDKFLWPPDQCFDFLGVYREACDPVSPHMDATNTSFSQVHDALFLGTSYMVMLRRWFRDTTLKTCCGKLRLCTHYPVPVTFFFAGSGNHCDTYYSMAGYQTIESVCPSMVGHELGHALIDCTSKLSNTEQPGSIAESFSDLSAIMLKVFLNNSNTSWKIGDEIVRPIVKQALRYMDDPPLDGVSLDCATDFTKKNRFAIHNTNGIYNKGIFHLASMDNWDVKKVFKIFLLATKVYWKQNVGYDEGLCDLISAAKDLGYDSNDVAKAFAKVGVFCECPNGWIRRTEFITRKSSRSSCFRFVNDTATWSAAQDYCDSLDAKLAVLDNGDKAFWVYDNSDQISEYWVGATYVMEQNSWMWAPYGIPVTWTDWFPGQPTHHNNKQCMAIRRNNTTMEWGWNSYDCASQKKFICELSCCGKACRRGF